MFPNLLAPWGIFIFWTVLVVTKFYLHWMKIDQKHPRSTFILYWVLGQWISPTLRFHSPQKEVPFMGRQLLSRGWRDQCWGLKSCSHRLSASKYLKIYCESDFQIFSEHSRINGGKMKELLFFMAFLILGCLSMWTVVNVRLYVMCACACRNTLATTCRCGDQRERMHHF